MKIKMPLIRALIVLLLSILSSPLQAAERQSIYVAPSGALEGTGATADEPFVLRPGREYDLNHLIRHATDVGHDVEVLFDDGIYRDVRLQIIKQGIDTDTVYLLEPGADAAGHASKRGGKLYHYHSYARCNREEENCRVMPEDYALGPHSNAAVLLVAKHPYKAIFDGAAFQAANPLVNNGGLVIAGGTREHKNVKSEPIKNVTVREIIFRNYRNGINVRHGLGITIEDCRIENIGVHQQKRVNNTLVGVSGFTANGDSQVVLVRHVTIRNVWNDKASYPDMIHSVYDGDSRDIIFMDDTFEGSSGPMLKFGYYPTFKNGKLVYQYPDKVWQRRGFFIANHFILSPMMNRHHPIEPFRPMQAFIHDNSQDTPGRHTHGGTSVEDIVSSPAKGMVFINNDFHNLFPQDDGLVVAFLRQELPQRGRYPQFPGFKFAGNLIEGIPADALVVHRYRDTKVMEAEHDDPLKLPVPMPELLHQTGEHVDVDKTIDKLLAGPLRSPDAARDQQVAFIIHTGRIPRLD